MKRLAVLVCFMVAACNGSSEVVPTTSATAPVTTAATQQVVELADTAQLAEVFNSVEPPQLILLLSPT